MPQITIEYMIMIPLLILQIFLFPLVAGLIMNGWADSRRTLELQETGSHLGSSIQQLYSSLNHDSISTGLVTDKLELPPFIEGYAYEGNATLRTALDPLLNSSKILDITLTLKGTNIHSALSVTLGQNAEWQDSVFASNSTNLSVNAEKYFDHENEAIIRLSFGS